MADLRIEPIAPSSQPMVDPSVGDLPEAASRPTGLLAALLALVEWTQAINDMQAVTSEATQGLTQLLRALSDDENRTLATDTAAIQAATKSEDIQKAQAQWQSDKIRFDSWIAKPQALTEAYENTVGDLSKTTNGAYTNMQSIVQFWINLANIMK